MKHNEQDSLIEHIRTVMYNHHEPYVLGSWERFNRQKLEKEYEQQFLWLRRIAAILLLTAAGFYVWFQPSKELTPPQMGAVEQPEQLPDSNVEFPSAFELSDSDNELITANRLPDVSEINDDQITGHKPGPGSDEILLPLSTREIPSSWLKIHQSWVKFTNAGTPGVREKPKQTTQNNDPLTWTPGWHALAETRQRNHYRADAELIQAVTRSDKNLFEVGLTYLPILNFHESQALPGMAGGLSAGWHITDNLTITSGLLVSQNNLKYDIGHGSLMHKFESTEQTLATIGEPRHIQVNLLSLELPIGIRYSINNQFSLSAGISSVTYLRERYNYEFEQELHVQVITDNPQEPTTRAVRATQTMQQKEPSFNATDWAAFYTFSVGYRFGVADRSTFTLEPFLKIPNQQVASRDIRYTTGGVQLTLTF